MIVTCSLYIRVYAYIQRNSVFINLLSEKKNLLMHEFLVNKVYNKLIKKKKKNKMKHIQSMLWFYFILFFGCSTFSRQKYDDDTLVILVHIFHFIH